MTTPDPEENLYLLESSKYHTNIRLPETLNTIIDGVKTTLQRGTPEFDRYFFINRTNRDLLVIKHRFIDYVTVVTMPRGDSGSSLLGFHGHSMYVHRFTSVTDEEGSYIWVSLSIDVSALHWHLRQNIPIPLRNKLAIVLSNYKENDYRSTHHSATHEFIRIATNPIPTPPIKPYKLENILLKNIPLFDFQRRKVEWMRHVENEISANGGYISINDATFSEYLEISPLASFNYNTSGFVETNSIPCTDKAYKFRGGCIFDDHGLGKTRTVISRCIQDRILGDATSATLIICPSETCTPWLSEIHEIDPTAKVQVLTSKPVLQKLSIQVLKTLDYVIVSNSFAAGSVYNAPILDIIDTETYATDELYKAVIAEHVFVDDGVSSSHLILHQYQWRRVVIDEAHVDRPGGLDTGFARTLKSDFIWLLSGLPSVLFTCLSSSAMVFDVLMYVDNDERVNLEKSCGDLARGFSSRLCSRETYETVRHEVDIPVCSERFIELNFTEEERARYEYLLSRSPTRSIADFCLHHDRETRSREPLKTASSREEAIAILQEDIQLRENMFTSDLEKLHNRGNVSVFSEQAEMQAILNINTITEELKDAKDVGRYLTETLLKPADVWQSESCVVCLEPRSKEMSMLPCGHLFCLTCGLLCALHQKRCPECRANVWYPNVIRINPNKEAIALGERIHKYGTKFAHFLGYLEQHSTEKIIVFTQTDDRLRKVRDLLSEVGIQHARSFGSGDLRKREVATFVNPNSECNIFLICPTHPCRGVSLTICTKIIILDNYYNSAEEKAVTDKIMLSKVQRITQKGRPEVIRMIMKGSIEEMVINADELL